MINIVNNNIGFWIKKKKIKVLNYNVKSCKLHALNNLKKCNIKCQHSCSDDQVLKKYLHSNQRVSFFFKYKYTILSNDPAGPSHRNSLKWRFRLQYLFSHTHSTYYYYFTFVRHVPTRWWHKSYVCDDGWTVQGYKVSWCIRY